MAIISNVQALSTTDLALSLERYAQLTGYSECAIFGVNKTGEDHGDCDNRIWTLSTRLLVVKYLREAQDEIEQVVGYPLSPRWFEAEQHPFSFPVHSQWMKVIEVGQRTVNDISLGETVDYTNDPAEVLVNTSVTDPNEIHVFHPGSDLEVNPSSISIVAGVATIKIPRCRLVLEAEMDNEASGLDYTDDANFEAEVDVKRIYTDPSVNAKLVYFHHTSDVCTCSALTCGEIETDACLTVHNSKTGAMGPLRATYQSAAWTPLVSLRPCYRPTPDVVRLYYKAGMTRLSYQAEDTILRLAHAKMPSSPCGCDVLQQLWARDTHVPDILDSARLECPFGLSDGAWIAWKFANAMKNVRAGVI